MQIFLDSADLREIEEVYGYGIIDGLTTNPTLLAKTKTKLTETITQICAIVSGDVSIEVTANDYENMLAQSDKICQLASNIVIKLPLTWDGIRTCKYLSHKGIKTNMTLCFSANQALLAAKAGATYVSPFIGRLDDIGQDGIKLIKDIRQIFDNYPMVLNTKILAASIRNPLHVTQAALVGADVITMPGKLIKQLLEHPLTSQGLQMFNDHWSASGLKF